MIARMETVEEPTTTLVTEEGAAPEVEQPVAEAAPETGGGSGAEPAKEEGGAAPDLYSLLTQEFEDAPDGSELDEVAKTITPETLKKADPVTRAVLRAVLAKAKEKESALSASASEKEKALAAKEAAIQKRERQINQQRQALLAMAAKAKAPEAEPEVDPLTAEGQKKLAEFAAQRAVADAFAPLRAESEEVARQAAWQAIVDRHADLTDPKVAAEFDTFMEQANKGWDGKGRPPVPTDLGADLFFSRRTADQLRAEMDAKRARQEADRRTAVRAVGRSHGGGTPSPLARFDALMESGRQDEAWALAKTDQTVRDAVVKRAAATL